MDGNVFVAFVAVAVPIIAIAASSTANRIVRLREKQIELAASQAAEKAARYAANGAEMEQRIRVLERIVTNRGLDLAEEIERLDGMSASAKLRSN